MGSENNMVAVREALDLLREARDGIAEAWDLTAEPGNVSARPFMEPEAADLIVRIDDLLARLAQPDAQQGASSPDWCDTQTGSDWYGSWDNSTLHKIVGVSSPASGKGVERLREAGRASQHAANNVFHELNRNPDWQPTRADFATLGHILHNIAGIAGPRATPLAAATQPAVPQEVAVERAARAMCKADGLDPDEEIIGGQASGFQNYGPLWQAEEWSEGQLGLANYKRLARAALTGAGENGEQGA